MWRKAMDYLGLGPEDAYDDYDEFPEQPARGRSPRDREPAVRQPRHADHDDRAPRAGYPAASDVVVRRPAPAPDDSSVQPRPINPPRPVPTRSAVSAPTGEPHTVRPRRFDAAQEVADKFKEGTPVIMNLEGADREVSRRLIDFASGLCYGLDGTMEKVATGVYLLKPAGARHDDTDYDR